ncbi:MAG: alpha-L-rhamnosidase [Verrucomicrobia bacterium]|nr:MAG: alpha-L-rhamnosidase [Verrucomicrobiota bacterium]
MALKFHTVLVLLGTLLAAALRVQGAATHLVDENPVGIAKDESGAILIDFGRVAFGNIRLMPPAMAKGSIAVHFGEALVDGRINRTPPGTVRYNKTTVSLDGKRSVVAAPPPDPRNTEQDSPKHPPAILTPLEWGVVLPFRWVEIEGWEGELLPEQIIRQSAFSSTWDDDAAAFESSDEMLDRVWELCRYSIKATTFAGVYVDGDRERIPYEADAHNTQFSQYYTDNDVQMARDTIDHLMKYPTWPSECAPHMVFMAHADWLQTGDKQWLSAHYETLKTKTLIDRRGADDLVSSNEKQVKKTDLVDWPPNERDGYVFTSRNTVVNAFHLRAMALMGEMARVLGKEDEARVFESSFNAAYTAFQETFFNAGKGLYRDGIDTDHTALHANLFPLVFGLAPEAGRAKMTEWLADRGMVCSVYAAQYLMEALFENGADRQAIELMTAKNDRSWRHMVESGTTITWEAWDQKYKPNQDWNHAWGAAPANLLPRYILGAQPLTPGWETARIRPSTGGLAFAKGKVPTPRGPIFIDWKNSDTFSLSLTLPKGMAARVELPMVGISSGVFSEGDSIKATRVGNRWVFDHEVEGTVSFEVR